MELSMYIKSFHDFLKQAIAPFFQDMFELIYNMPQLLQTKNDITFSKQVFFWTHNIMDWF